MAGDAIGQRKPIGRPKVNDGICKLDLCSRRASCRGLCMMHYHRLMRHGDTSIAKSGRDGPLRTYADSLIDGEAKADCVIWPFARDNSGYALMRIKGRSNLAHRYICEEASGPPPHPESVVRHLCGRGGQGCVNPAHLVWGTKQENQMDRVLHDTHHRGERHGMSKLSEVQVREILKRSASGEPAKRIAVDHGVTAGTIRGIASGKSWSWMQREVA